MELLLFANTAADWLARTIAISESPSGKDMTIRLGKAIASWFPDDEPRIEITENVSGKSVVVLGGLSALEIEGKRRSVNDHFMQLRSLLDALWRAKAQIVTIILPYFAYSRQDRRSGEASDRTAITAKLAAEDLDRAAHGLAHACVIEPHTGQLMAYFPCRNDAIPALHMFVPMIRKAYPDPDRIVVVSPDRGGVPRASAYASHHGIRRELVYIDKRRIGAGKAHVMQVVGEVDGCDAVIVDDIIDSAGTICEAAEVLIARGAQRVVVIAAHGVFSGPAFDRIAASKITAIYTLDTIPHTFSPEIAEKIKVVPCAPLLLETIYRHCRGESIRDIGSLREPRETVPRWADEWARSIIASAKPCPKCKSAHVRSEEGLTDFVPDPSHGSNTCLDCGHSWSWP